MRACFECLQIQRARGVIEQIGIGVQLAYGCSELRQGRRHGEHAGDARGGLAALDVATEHLVAQRGRQLLLEDDQHCALRAAGVIECPTHALPVEPADPVDVEQSVYVAFG